MPREYQPNDTTVEIFWHLLRAFEEKCGNSAGPLDAALISASYRHAAKLFKKPMQPVYVKETPAARTSQAESDDESEQPVFQVEGIYTVRNVYRFNAESLEEAQIMADEDDEEMGQPIVSEVQDIVEVSCKQLP